jgi:Alpha amylase, catalytic domain
VKKVISIFIILFYLLTNSFPAHADEKMDRQWQDETIYSIMIDRFHNANQSNDQDVNMEDPASYHGGDFLGIIDKLDYIREMGFTTISLSPIFDHGDGNYQGYGVNDFYQTDEHFGTIEEFQRLVAEAHNRDMKVMIDLGVKYVSPNHSWMTDPTKEGWLKPQGVKVAQQNVLEINLDNREVNQYMMDVAKWWIAETDLDGYRLLFLDEVPESFLKNFSKEVKALKESFYLLGEVKDTDFEKKASYLQAGIDGITDYTLSNELRNVFQQPDQSISSLFALIESDSQVYANPNRIGTFMDNEQMTRFTREAIENNQHPGPRWRQALTFLYTTPGVPIVSYGSEIAMDGGEAPDNLRQMNFRTDPELMEYMTKIGDLRATLPSLTKGEFEVLYENEGFAIFKRQFENETTVVAINNTIETQSAAIPAQKLTNDMELRGMLNGDLVRSKNSEYMMTIDRDESEIYILKEKTDINFTYLIVLALILVSFAIFLYLVWKKSRKQQQ